MESPELLRFFHVLHRIKLKWEQIQRGDKRCLDFYQWTSPEDLFFWPYAKIHQFLTDFERLYDQLDPKENKEEAVAYREMYNILRAWHHKAWIYRNPCLPPPRKRDDVRDFCTYVAQTVSAQEGKMYSWKLNSLWAAERQMVPVLGKHNLPLCIPGYYEQDLVCVHDLVQHSSFKEVLPATVLAHPNKRTFGSWMWFTSEKEFVLRFVKQQEDVEAMFQRASNRDILFHFF